jgi:hypothetical protein
MTEIIGDFDPVPYPFVRSLSAEQTASIRHGPGLGPEREDPFPTYCPFGGQTVGTHPGHHIETYADREYGAHFARAYWDFYSVPRFGLPGGNPDPSYYTDELLAEIGREPV